MPGSSRGLRLFLLGCGLAVAACSGDDTTGPGRSSIVLAPRPLVAQGLDLQLTATILDGDGNPVSGRTITFASSDTTIVTISPTGLLHSVGPLGSALVTAESGTLRITVSATVVQRITSVTVPDSLELPQLAYRPLPVEFRDFTGALVVNPANFLVVSFDTTIVAVDSAQFLRAKGVPGTTAIRIVGANVSKSFQVRVRQVPFTIEGPQGVVLQAGQSRQVKLLVRDMVFQPMANAPLNFASLDPAVFSVDANGLVTAVGGQGTGTLQVTTIESVSRTIPVYVGNTEPRAITEQQSTDLVLPQAAISSGGVVLAAGYDYQSTGYVLMGDIASLSLPISIKTGAVALGVTVNHAGTRAYVATSANLQVIDLATAQVMATVPLVAGGNQAIVITPDDQTAWVGSDTRIYKVNLATNTVVDTIPVPLHARYLALDPVKQRLYISDLTVRELDLATKTVIRTYPLATGAGPVALSPDGQTLYVVDHAVGAVRIYATGGELAGTIDPLESAYSVAVSETYVVVGGGGRTFVYRRATGALIGAYATSYDASGFGGGIGIPAISPDERTVVVPDLNGTISFIQ